MRLDKKRRLPHQTGVRQFFHAYEKFFIYKNCFPYIRTRPLPYDAFAIRCRRAVKSAAEQIKAGTGNLHKVRMLRYVRKLRGTKLHRMCILHFARNIASGAKYPYTITYKQIQHYSERSLCFLCSQTELKLSSGPEKAETVM